MDYLLDEQSHCNIFYLAIHVQLFEYTTLYTVCILNHQIKLSPSSSTWSYFEVNWLHKFLQLAAVGAMMWKSIPQWYPTLKSFLRDTSAGAVATLPEESAWHLGQQQFEDRKTYLISFLMKLVWLQLFLSKSYDHLIFWHSKMPSPSPHLLPFPDVLPPSLSHLAALHR